MRIGFDATVLAPATRYTGTGQYAENLLRHLPPLAPNDEFIVYGEAPTPPIADPQPNLTWQRIPPLRLGKLTKIATHLFVLPRLAKKHQLDVLHVPTVHTRASLPPVPRSLKPPLVVTLHDLIPITHYGGTGQPLPWRMRAYYRWNLGAAKNANRIITVSESSRREILDTLDLPEDRVIAIHNAVDWDVPSEQTRTAAPEPPGVGAPYILFGGSFEPRKNLTRTLQAFDRAVQRGLMHHLVMIVDSGSGHAAAIRQWARSLSCSDRLHYLSQLEEPALRAVYAAADLFVFPSLAEGFGLPPLQAMACGIPVIASDIPVMHEILGDAAHYVDPYSVDSIASALILLTSDAEKAGRLALSGPVQAKRFSWENAAMKTLDVYRSLAPNSRRQRTADSA